MLDRLKENRLKLVSVLCVIADALMGLAGAKGLWHAGGNTADLLLAVAGGLGLFGHSFILGWGKGGRREKNAAPPPVPADAPHIFLRPFFFSRYPLDASFLVFSFGGLCFFGAGLASNNPPLTLFGGLGMSTSLFGWLWPQDKTVFGRHTIQICAALYLISGLSSLVSGLYARNLFMTLAGCCYVAANCILFTVRKENQSQYTIGRE